MEFYRDKFRAHRLEKMISLKQISQQIGKSYRTILAWEKGERNPGESDIRILAQLLEISSSQFSNIIDIIPSQLDSKKKLTVEDIINANPHELLNHINTLNKKNDTLEKKNDTLETDASIYKTIVDSIQTYIFTKDINKKFTDANFAVLSAFNITKEEIIGKKYSDILPPKELTEYKILEDEIFENKIAILNKKIMMPGSNGKRQGLISFYPTFDDKHNFNGIIGSLRDITDILETENKQVLLESAINSLEDAVWILKTKPIEQIVYASDPIEQIYGEPPEMFYKNREFWYEVIHPEDRKRIRSVFRDSDNYPHNHKYRIIRKDGAVRWIRDRAYKKIDNNGDLIKFGIISDITEQILTGQRRELLESAINNISDIVWVGKFLEEDKSQIELEYLNNAPEEILGYKTEIFVENPFLLESLVHPDDADKKAEWVRCNDYPKSIEYRIIRPDRELKWLRQKAFLQGNTTFGIISDITAQKLGR